MAKGILEQLADGIVLGDGGYIVDWSDVATSSQAHSPGN